MLDILQTLSSLASSIRSRIADGYRQFIKHFHFKKIADFLTDPEALYLPALGTFIALFAFGGAITIATLAWEGALVTLASFMHEYVMTAGAILGLVVFNYWFKREMDTVMHKGRALEPDEVSGKPEDPEHQYRILPMIKHLVAESNALHGTPPGHPKHLDTVKAFVITDHHPKLIGSPGRKPALYISSGMLLEGGLTPKELAAILAVKIEEAHLFVSGFNVITGAVISLLQTINNFKTSDYTALRLLGSLPIISQLLTLTEKSLSRGYMLREMRNVIRNGRGADLQVAQRKLFNPSQVEGSGPGRSTRADYTDYWQATMESNFLSRPFAFLGRMFDILVKPLADWVRDHEYAEDSRDYRVSSFLNIAFREISKQIREAFSDTLSATTTKVYVAATIAKETKAGRIRLRDIPAEVMHGPIILEGQQALPVAPVAAAQAQNDNNHAEHSPRPRRSVAPILVAAPRARAAAAADPIVESELSLRRSPRAKSPARR